MGNHIGLTAEDYDTALETIGVRDGIQHQIDSGNATRGARGDAYWLQQRKSDLEELGVDPDISMEEFKAGYVKQGTLQGNWATKAGAAIAGGISAGAAAITNLFDSKSGVSAADKVKLDRRIARITGNSEDTGGYELEGLDAE